MIFSSLTFLQGFLPLCLLIYFLVPRQRKNLVLLLASLFFYAWGEPIYVVLMIFSTLLDYCCGRAVEHFRAQEVAAPQGGAGQQALSRSSDAQEIVPQDKSAPRSLRNKARIPLLISLCGNLGLLCVFKYSDFLIATLNSLLGTDFPQPNLPLPIGISFYTFQTMSYTIDVYRGEVNAQKNLLDFAAYVTLFPQLIAGPIVRYQSIAEELEHRDHTPDLFAEGTRRFVCGLAKKILLANNIGLLWEVASAQAAPTMLTAWLGAITYGFQIYFDFSGYSDMAIGLGCMLGFHFPENFNYPFIADSITDFWKRWHISMSSWFRDYVYIPLGGSRCGLAKQLRNIAVVWLLTGFWHGASWNFVLWGVYFGILLILEKLCLLRLTAKLPQALRHLYALLLISFSWPIFGFENIRQGVVWIRAMLGGSTLCDQSALYLLVSYLPMLLLCALAAMPIGHRLYQRLCGTAPCTTDVPVMATAAQKRAAVPNMACGPRLRSVCLQTLLECSGMLCLLLLSMAYLVSGSYNPFLYFRF